MRTYTITRVDGSPDWNSIEKAPIDNKPWKEFPLSMEVFAQACHNGGVLQARLTAGEKDPLARFSGDTDMVCLDSCLEFFFSPMADGRYFNFEFNPKGALYLGFGTGRDFTARLLVKNYRDFFSVKPFAGGGFWGVEFTVPAVFIALYCPGFTLEKGRVFTANFYKCGDETKTPHYLVWNPVDTEKPDYHRPEYFGKIILE
ncbi:MAG: hypothetical protein LBB78_09220 [Spirochaetaceae bacterium]|jgi:hypothetical protein|nr:hypothetical protein [Spirochaetaceae bacterium]